MSADNKTGPGDVSCSVDWPVFSLVDDDEALIKVNVDIIDLSHSVTDESDDTAFCQATIEFNSLDVIGQLFHLSYLCSLYCTLQIHRLNTLLSYDIIYYIISYICSVPITDWI